MARYWVVAPYASTPQSLFDKVWEFDLLNKVLSTGWHEVNDVSTLSRESLNKTVSEAYPEKPVQTQSLYANMLWSFYHEMQPGDFVIARRGRKVIAGVGKISGTGRYEPGKNPLLAEGEKPHCNYISVEWQKTPRDKMFPTIVFGMPTLSEISKDDYDDLVEGVGLDSMSAESDETIEDPASFVLEKYLEDFIVTNFSHIFNNELKLYGDGEGGDGQQFQTDIGTIDILATDVASQDFVVIELKKGRPSDRVVGQILRYMGWVSETLCTHGQQVRGIIICHANDPKMTYALKMTQNIDVRLYKIDFQLSTPS